MTAMILEKLGFDLIYMTGYGTAAAMGMECQTSGWPQSAR
jgi:2-methylisocitrate lyase-like PEP mutase family enzyme